MKKNPILLGALFTIAVIAGLLSLRAEIASFRRKRNHDSAASPDGFSSADGSRVPLDDHPSNEDIARLAQQYWEAEGCPEGKAQEHWRRAEEELRHHFSDAAPAT